MPRVVICRSRNFLVGNKQEKIHSSASLRCGLVRVSGNQPEMYRDTRNESTIKGLDKISLRIVLSIRVLLCFHTNF